MSISLVKSLNYIVVSQIKLSTIIFNDPFVCNSIVTIVIIATDPNELGVSLAPNLAKEQGPRGPTYEMGRESQLIQ